MFQPILKIDKTFFDQSNNLKKEKVKNIMKNSPVMSPLNFKVLIYI